MLLAVLLILSGCKKDTEETKAGGEISPALSSAAPVEIPEMEAIQTHPSAEETTKLLSIHTIPAHPQASALPDMTAITGMDMKVRISPRMKNDPAWAGSFPALYKAAGDCMTQMENGAAYIAGIPQYDTPEIRVVVVGLDGYWYECLIEQGGGTARVIKEIEPYHESGPAFFPMAAGRPKIDNPQCTALESVVAHPQGLIGWLGFKIPDCRLTAPD